MSIHAERPLRDPSYEQRVRASFARQSFMRTLGVSLTRVEPGEVDLVVPFRGDLVQQHGFLHAGVVTSVLDSACGYAALTLMEPGTAVLSVEFKVQLLAPARGTEFLACGRVVRSGRTLTVVSGEFRAVASGEGRDAPASSPLIALLNGTMISLHDRDGLSD